MNFVDIHCHLLPNIDDGAKSLDESIAMARMAVADGIETIIVTPHQLDRFRRNTPIDIRQAVSRLQIELNAAQIDLKILPGADVRIEVHLVELIKNDQVLTLGDHRKHVLLELPHELYFPIEKLIGELRQIGITAILSHPERNQGLMQKPDLVASLVDDGCLMQITAGSITGTFGGECQSMSEFLLNKGLVHFVASDAHGSKRRRPRLREAFDRVAGLIGVEATEHVFVENPNHVAAGENVESKPIRRSRNRRFLGWRKKRVA